MWKILLYHVRVTSDSHWDWDILSLLVDIYRAMRQMSSMLEIDFCFPRHGSRQQRSDLPEIRLVALLIIAVKIYYPFDLLDRHPRSQLDIAVLNIDWDKWCQLQKQHDLRLTSEGKIGRGNEMLINEQDVMNMSGEQLDEYLVWYEKMWISEDDDEHTKRGLPKQLLDMFPTSRVNASSAAAIDFDAETKAEGSLLDEKLGKVQNRLKLRSAISKEGEGKHKETLRRLGNFYKRYRKIEDLPLQAKAFHEAVASLIGVSMATLVMAVLQMERKIQLWRAKHLKLRQEESEEDEFTNEIGSVTNNDTQASSSELDQE